MHPSGTTHHPNRGVRDGSKLNKEFIMRTSLHHLADRLANCLAPAGVALVMSWVGTAQAAGGFDLITADEARATAQAEVERPEIRTRQVPTPPRPNMPGIKVVSPNAVGTAVAAPVRIEVAFTPAPGARIVPSSFRVLYGLLKIDLTERLRQHATVTESGVVVDGAKVPDGQHRLILQVADDKGNTAEQELRIRVGAAS
jgi:hypothetical protein